MRPVAAGLSGFVELLFGAWCAVCGRPQGPLCDDCAAVLTTRERPCAPREGCPPMWAAGPYQGPARQAVLAFKEGGRRDLAEPLGRLLAATAEPIFRWAPPGFLVPVPSRRRYDPVLLLAQTAAAELRDRGRAVTALPALEYIRRGHDQVGLDARQRRVNMSGALRVHRRAQPLVPRRRVLVVDDVVTTGATVAEAARALRAVSTHVTGAVVLAERE